MCVLASNPPPPVLQGDAGLLRVLAARPPAGRLHTTGGTTEHVRQAPRCK